MKMTITYGRGLIGMETGKKTKEEYFKELEDIANTPTTYIKDKTSDLVKRLLPVLSEEDKQTLLLATEGQPNVGEVRINWYVPQEWLKENVFKEFMWNWYCMMQGGGANEENKD